MPAEDSPPIEREPAADASQLAETDAPTHDAELAEPEATTVAPPSQVAGAGSEPPSPRPTLAGRVWVAIVVAAILLILLIIFIAENSQKVTISFLGAHGTISLALAMLIAAVAGVLITLLVGSARILQLRLEVQRRRRAQRQAERASTSE